MYPILANCFCRTLNAPSEQSKPNLWPGFCPSFAVSSYGASRLVSVYDTRGEYKSQNISDNKQGLCQDLLVGLALMLVARLD